MKPKHTSDTLNTRVDSARVNRESQKNPKRLSAARRRRLAEEAMEEVVEHFASLPAFSFVFVGHEGPYSVGPNLISAIDLVCCMSNGMDYAGPHPECEFVAARTEASKRRDEIVAVVRQRLSRLRRLGADFVVCWQAYGEAQPNLEHSNNYGSDDVPNHLVDYMQHELADRIDV